MIFAAISASIVPISASGQHIVISAPTDFEFMTTYALPSAFPVITFTFGTVAFAKAYTSFAALRAICLSSHFVAAYPVVLVSERTGISNASQKATNSAAFSQPCAVKTASYFSATSPFSS